MLGNTGGHFACTGSFYSRDTIINTYLDSLVILWITLFVRKLQFNASLFVIGYDFCVITTTSSDA